MAVASVSRRASASPVCPRKLIGLQASKAHLREQHSTIRRLRAPPRTRPTALMLTATYSRPMNIGAISRRFIPGEQLQERWGQYHPRERMDQASTEADLRSHPLTRAVLTT